MNTTMPSNLVQCVDYHSRLGIVEGLQNPRGLGLGYVGVGVRVGISVPQQNPYPQQGFRGMYGDKNICKYHIYSPQKSISSANIFFFGLNKGILHSNRVILS